MKLLESFALQHVDDVIRNTFSVFDEQKSNYSLNEVSDNNGVSYLELKGEGIIQQFVLVKVMNKSKSETIKNASVLQPVFIIENNHKERYGAFEKERINNFVTPEQNNLDHVKAILNTLAQYQAAVLANIEDKELFTEYPLEEVTSSILFLDYFKNIEKDTIKYILKEVHIALDRILKTNLLVTSLWSSSANNVFINKDGSDSLFLEVDSQQPLPPAYDALLYIFSMSDEKFRQKHFEDLTSHYFKCLADILHQQDSNACKEISRKYTEVQVKTLLPVIKFKYANDLAKANSSPRFEDIVANISNYFKCPLIHQEDVYQVSKNKLLSDDYDLLDYQLVPLNEKNGHLGEYFQLKISTKFQNEVKNLNFFGKFLIGATEFLRQVLESGVGKKEDFFYTTLYQTYQNHGLENLLDFAPKCYLSRLSGFLILEDFGSLGYTAFKPNAVLNYDALKIMLAKLAKFHASTLIVEEKLSKESGKKVRLGDLYEEYFNNAMFKYDGPLQNHFDAALESLYYILSKFPDLTEKLNFSDEQLKIKLKDIWFSPFVRIKKSDVIRNVVNHGDMYIPNMLIKFGQDTVEDGVLVDFQMLRYVPPAYEALFFIYVTSTKDTRDKYSKSLMDWYYESICNHLQTFNLDSEEILPRKQFNYHVNYIKPAALATAFNYGYVTYTDPDFREEIMHDQEKTKYYLEDHRDELIDISLKIDHYKARVRGLIEDFIDLVKNDVQNL